MKWNLSFIKMFSHSFTVGEHFYVLGNETSVIGPRTTPRCTLEMGHNNSAETYCVTALFLVCSTAATSSGVYAFFLCINCWIISIFQTDC